MLKNIFWWMSFDKICNNKDHGECQNKIIKKEQKSPMFDCSISIILIKCVFPIPKLEQV